LPENWSEPVAPKGAAFSSKKGLSEPSGTMHDFAANGYNYSVTIAENSDSSVAERGEALALDSLVVERFGIEDGWLLVSVKAKPDTWLYGFADTLSIRASKDMLVHEEDGEDMDLSRAELRLEDGDRAGFAVPLGKNEECRFFRVERR
jgi:hypothetical protein